MRVYEVAKELSVSSEALVHLLREMDVPVRSHMTQLGDEHIARLRTVMERERRLGHGTTEQAIEAAIEDAHTGARRRRRRRADTPDETSSPTADAAEAMAAEAAEEALAEAGTAVEGTVERAPVIEARVMPFAEPVIEVPRPPPPPASAPVPPRRAAPP